MKHSNLKTHLSDINSKNFRNNSSGFTIVELLIVIVIIGILAALVIVAYTGIQARAHDTSVQADLKNFAKAVRLYEADKGIIPPGGSRTMNSAGMPGMKIAVAEGSYDLNATANMSYCEGTISGEAVFAMSAKSKSGTVFAYKSWGGMESRGNVSHATNTACLGIDSGTTGLNYGYNSSLDTWWSWTQG